MKKVALVIALVAAVGFVMSAEPASAFLFGGGGGCGGGGGGLFGGGHFGGLFGHGKASYGGAGYGCGYGYACAPMYYGCAPAPCKVYKKRAKKGAAPVAPAPKVKKEKKMK